MIAKTPTSQNNVFTHNNRFGPTIPIIEPSIAIVARLNKKITPATLHTTVNITGVYNDAEFIYENEENIEIIPEDATFTLDELLEEVKKSVNRCFDDSYDACIRSSLPFPFVRTHQTNVDLTQVSQQLEQDLL